MREQMERKNRKEKKTKNSKVSRFVSRNFGTILKLALLIAIVAAIGVGVRVINVSESKTTKIVLKILARWQRSLRIVQK